MIEVPENPHEIDAYKEFWGPQLQRSPDHPACTSGPGPARSARTWCSKPCLKILDEMFFYTNGNATICCWDVHERAVIGNVHEQSVQEIWESYAARCICGPPWTTAGAT